MRVYYYKSYKDLAFILLNNVNLFYTVIINFIINMLSARDFYTRKINDTILIIINKLTKYVTYIVVVKDLNVKKLANIL